MKNAAAIKISLTAKRDLLAKELDALELARKRLTELGSMIPRQAVVDLRNAIEEINDEFIGTNNQLRKLAYDTRLTGEYGDLTW